MVFSVRVAADCGGRKVNLWIPCYEGRPSIDELFSLSAYAFTNLVAISGGRITFYHDRFAIRGMLVFDAEFGLWRRLESMYQIFDRCQLYVLQDNVNEYPSVIGPSYDGSELLIGYVPPKAYVEYGKRLAYSRPLLIGNSDRTSKRESRFDLPNSGSSTSNTRPDRGDFSNSRFVERKTSSTTRAFPTKSSSSSRQLDSVKDSTTSSTVKTRPEPLLELVDVSSNRDMNPVTTIDKPRRYLPPPPPPKKKDYSRYLNRPSFHREEPKPTRSSVEKRDRKFSSLDRELKNLPDGESVIRAEQLHIMQQSQLSLDELRAELRRQENELVRSISPSRS